MLSQNALSICQFEHESFAIFYIFQEILSLFFIYLLLNWDWKILFNISFSIVRAWHRRHLDVSLLNIYEIEDKTNCTENFSIFLSFSAIIHLSLRTYSGNSNQSSRKASMLFEFTESFEMEETELSERQSWYRLYWYVTKKINSCKSFLIIERP